MVKISELKAKLSAYLERVRRGETVLVYDRNTPIARLVPFEEDRDEFRVEEAKRPLTDWKKIKGVKLREPIDVVKLLREDRDAR